MVAFGPVVIDTAHRRLWNLRADGPPLKRAADVVEWLVASQAQDFAGAKWALGLRMPAGTTDADVEREFDAGAILRTHMMRPTWHFVTPADIRWMLALTGPRVNAVSAYRYRQLELDAATFRKANAVFARILRGGRQLTRDELRADLAKAGVVTDGQRMAHILLFAELDALVCSGPRRGRQFTYALLDDRVPSARARSRPAALAALAGRYFRSRGPASVNDFAKWSGLTVGDARAGLEAVAPKLQSETVARATLWFDAASRPRPPRPPNAHLLSIYDEYISSYRDRSAMCEPATAKRLVGMGAALTSVIVVDGRIVGTWRRVTAKRAVRVELQPFRDLALGESRAVAAAVRRFEAFAASGPAGGE